MLIATVAAAGWMEKRSFFKQDKTCQQRHAKGWRAVVRYYCCILYTQKV
uniref:Uncharacterized protein n=1 Tax=Rheinheimera sp. BAL341 TaxID=1708203 RepID=A0A486XMY7_9GAMM